MTNNIVFTILTDNIFSCGTFHSPKVPSTYWMGQQLVLLLHSVYILEGYSLNIETDRGCTMGQIVFTTSQFKQLGRLSIQLDI